ncbi:hypothetical protein IAU60_003692 [Kwoniella sp. DSM 27419]
MAPPGLIPSSFLPHLPRSQFTLSPLNPQDLLAHISVLRELYLPPIHGGFTAADALDDDKVVRGKKRERRFSAGLAETMSGMGLGLDVPLDPASQLGHVAGGMPDVLEDEETDETSDDEEEDEQLHLDPFEREWAEKWLSGVVRRTQGWIEENGEDADQSEQNKEMETVLRDATAVLAMMAGTSAAGSLTRHLVFPIDPVLAPALKQMHSSRSPNPALSPETNTFLASLSTSPTSPTSHMRRTSDATALSTSPTSPLAGPSTSPRRRTNRVRANTGGRRPVLPVLLHDAPMGDHLSVGVQTWGSAILLGREVAQRPADYGLFLPDAKPGRGVRVLELGAGTGLLSILCRKLLDLRALAQGTPPGLVVATDFLASVLDNLKICVDLNFPARGETNTREQGQALGHGIHIAKLDWTTFPAFMHSGEGDEQMASFVSGAGADGFDLVLASDCVYDETHARLLREVAAWVLKLPDAQGRGGGTFHILSPLRPTFAPELESIDTYFPPLSSYVPLSERQDAARTGSAPRELAGEGLGIARGLKLGARGQGKRQVKGKRGEGRTDENQGYWWWEVGWG